MASSEADPGRARHSRYRKLATRRTRLLNLPDMVECLVNGAVQVEPVSPSKPCLSVTLLGIQTLFDPGWASARSQAAEQPQFS